MSLQSKEEVANESKDYVKYLCTELQDISCHNKCFMINVDQTPVLFSIHPSKILDAKGVSIVYIKCGKYDTKRATVTL